MSELLEATPDVVLAVYAHPDDADVACAGTLARWAKAGSEVHVVICTNGGKGTPDPDVEVAALAARRAEEVAEAAAIVGIVSHHGLGMTDGELENTRELRAELVGWIRRVRPAAVLGHDPTAVFFAQHYFNHHDHRGVGRYWTPYRPRRRCRTTSPSRARRTRSRWPISPAPSNPTSGST